LQTRDSFARTLDDVIELGPDRLSVFNYAHLPHMFKTQRQIDATDLPAPEVKLDILGDVIAHLTGAGYVYIGMDHFARPEDELARAQQAGSLYRNFQGYSTHADCDLVALGATSIGMVGDTYSQNLRGIDDYAAAIGRGEIPVFRGVQLSADDRLRRDVITRLICNLSVPMPEVEATHTIRFGEYFETELAELARMQDDELVRVDPDAIQVLPSGRLLIRNICMVFDRYLREATGQRFSKVI